jgi:hypothetical protein
MALVSSGFNVTITLVDSGGNKSTLKFATNPAVVTDYATATTAATNLLADLQAITGALVGAYSINSTFRENNPILPADEEIEDKASMSFSMDNGKTGNLRVPAPVPGIFQGTTTELRNQLDISNGLVTAYFANFQAGGEFLVSETNLGIELLRGKRIHVKNSNG